MKSKLLLFALVFLVAVMTRAQSAIQWQKSLGGSGSDFASSIQQTTDSGYIIAGYSSSNDGDVTGNHGNEDSWIVKLNSAGTLQWQKSLGGTDDDQSTSIQQTTDGGYIVAGYSRSNDGNVTGNHGEYDYWIVKLNSAGIIEWQKSLGGSGSDFASAIQQTADGGYIVAGSSESLDGDVTGNHGDYDYWIVKLTGTGTLQWQKSLGGSGGDAATSIQQTTDSGYIVSGYSGSDNNDVTGNHGGFDYWIVKLNSTGSIEWQKSLGCTGEDRSYSIRQTGDGGYMAAGYSRFNDGDVTGNHGGQDYWIVKLNSAGTIEWQKSLGGTSYDYAYSIQQTTDSGYIVAGNSLSNDGDVTGNHSSYDSWIVKLNSAGIMEGQKSAGGTSYDYADAIQQTTDGGYIVAGSSISNNGDVTGNHGDYDYWIVKLSAYVGIEEPLVKKLSMTLSPNPASTRLTIRTFPFNNQVTISIMNVLGEIFQEEKLSRAEEIINIDYLSPGIYFFQMKSGDGSIVKMFVKE